MLFRIIYGFRSSSFSENSLLSVKWGSEGLAHGSEENIWLLVTGNDHYSLFPKLTLKQLKIYWALVCFYIDFTYLFIRVNRKTCQK